MKTLPTILLQICLKILISKNNIVSDKAPYELCGAFFVSPKNFSAYIIIMKIFDLHNDIVTAPGGLSLKENEIISSKQSGADVIYAVWSSELDKRSFYEKCEFLSESADMFSIEDSSITGKDYSVLKNSKLKCCSLTWNYDNIFGGGAYGIRGLTCAGANFIKELNKAGVILDVSHLNERTFFESAEVADRIIATHSGMNIVKKHPRNLSLMQIEKIVEKHGLVGLTPVPDFTDGGNLYGYLKSVDTFIMYFGYENLAIGSDFYGSEGIEGLRDYKTLHKNLFDHISLKHGKNAALAVLYDNAKHFFS